MKTIKFSALFLAMLFSTLLVSGKNYDLKGFTKIDAGYNANITLTQSPTYKVEVENSADIEPYLCIKVVGRTLVVTLESDNKIETGQKSYFNVNVSMPEIEKIDLSGAAKIASNGCFNLTGGNFEADLSGASKITGLNINSQKGSISLSGATNAEVTGVFSEFGIEQSGASRGRYNVSADDFEADLSGSSAVDAQGSYEICRIDCSGTSRALLKESAITKLEIDLSGTSNVTTANCSISSADVEMSGVSKADISVTDYLKVELSNCASLTYSGPDSLVVGKEEICSTAKLKKNSSGQ